MEHFSRVFKRYFDHYFVLNIAYSDLQIAAKTSGCKESSAQKVTYRFLDDYHGLCVDKRDIFEGEMRACESLLKYTQDVSERATLERKIAELRVILSLLRRDAAARAPAPGLATKKTAAKKASFVICQDCYWCASCFKQNSLPECPACTGHNMDILPIFEGEHYQLEFSKKRSVNLMFRTV